MDYISVREASAKWAISERRVQKLCERGRIDGVLRFGRSWICLLYTSLLDRLFQRQPIEKSHHRTGRYHLPPD